jgi:hypothetical protein
MSRPLLPALVCRRICMPGFEFSTYHSSCELVRTLVHLKAIITRYIGNEDEVRHEDTTYDDKEG